MLCVLGFNKTHNMFYKNSMPAKPVDLLKPRYFQGDLIVTAKDLAEAIAFKKDRGGFAKALRQIKHWTDKGLLRTITPLDTGSGVAREYVDSPTELIAAILQELVLLGCTIEQLFPVTTRLYNEFDDGDPDSIFDAAMMAGSKSYLALEYDIDDRGRLKLENIRTFIFNHPGDGEQHGEMPKARGSILLELGAIADRISWSTFKYRSE